MRSLLLYAACVNLYATSSLLARRVRGRQLLTLIAVGQALWIAWRAYVNLSLTIEPIAVVHAKVKVAYCSAG